MSGLKWSRLFYWRDVLLIDPRWCGASGTGAYIAVASRIVNETAGAVLKENPAPLLRYIMKNIIRPKDRAEIAVDFPKEQQLKRKIKPSPKAKIIS